MTKYKCIATYKHNPNCIVPIGAICEFEESSNRLLPFLTYKGRNMRVNWNTIRKYFEEVTE